MGTIKDRGFASMEKTAQRALARKGGIAAHAKGTAHEWTSESARAAGRKGGRITAERTAAAQKTDTQKPAA